MWPWDACWLQEGWQTAKRLEALEGLEGFKGLEGLMCGLGVAIGCRMKHAKSTFEGFYGF